MSNRDDLPPDDRQPQEVRSRFERPTPRPPQRTATNQAHPGTVRRRPEDRPPRQEVAPAERPREDRPSGDRPRGERPQGDRPYDDRPRGDRPPSRDRVRNDRPILTSHHPAPRREDRPRRDDRQAPPPDVVSGLHAVEALLRWQPKRVQALYLWASDEVTPQVGQRAGAVYFQERAVRSPVRPAAPACRWSRPIPAPSARRRPARAGIP